MKSSKNKKKNSLCGICLDQLTLDSTHQLQNCKCCFCKQCLDKYFQFMIDNGHLRIHCPSFKCVFKNPIPYDEIYQLVSGEHRTKFKQLLNKNLLEESFSNNNSVNRPNNNTEIKCPFCENVFDISKLQEQHQDSIKETSNAIENKNDENDEHQLMERFKPVMIFKCPKCSKISCTLCFSKLSGEDTRHDCRDLNESTLNEFDIKRCPNCNFLIQREGGCAQISCRNCCHVFCWHCLKSLDNDFLLFHYDSGPCKNRLGHSRLSIFFNRAQTISICVGISILMLLASPVIIAFLPCMLTKKCRMCCRKRKDSHSSFSQ